VRGSALITGRANPHPPHPEPGITHRAAPSHPPSGVRQPHTVCDTPTVNRPGSDGGSTLEWRI